MLKKTTRALLKQAKLSKNDHPQTRKNTAERIKFNRSALGKGLMIAKKRKFKGKAGQSLIPR